MASNFRHPVAPPAGPLTSRGGGQRGLAQRASRLSSLCSPDISTGCTDNRRLDLQYYLFSSFFSISFIFLTNPTIRPSSIPLHPNDQTPITEQTYGTEKVCIRSVNKEAPADEKILYGRCWGLRDIITTCRRHFSALAAGKRRLSRVPCACTCTRSGSYTFMICMSGHHLLLELTWMHVGNVCTTTQMTEHRTRFHCWQNTPHLCNRRRTHPHTDESVSR